MATEDKRIQRIIDAVSDIQNGQICIEEVVDPDLNFIAFGYKDTGGGEHKVLNKDEDARVADLEVTGSLTNSGNSVFVQGDQYIDLDTGTTAPSHFAGRLFWDQDNNCPTFYDSVSGTSVQISQESPIWACNNTGSTITNGQVVCASGVDTPTDCLEVSLANAATYDRSQVLAVATHDIVDGDQGKVVKFGRINDFDTSSLTEGEKVYLSSTNGILTSTRPTFPAKPIIVGYCIKSHATEGIILVDIVTDKYDYEFDGCIIEKQDYEVVVDSGTIYVDVEKLGGGDLPVQLAGEVYQLDCTTGSGSGGTARVALTVGTDTAPVYNYVYINLVGGIATLQSSITAPTGIYANVGYISVWSATRTSTDGVLMNRRTTDAINHGDSGHIQHLNEWARSWGARWVRDSGISPSATVGAATLDFSVTSGQAWQLHKQNFPAMQLSVDGAYVVNATGGAVVKYQKVFNGLTCAQTASGVAFSNNDFANFMIFGVINKTTAECKLLIGLPTDVYSTQSAAYNDTSGYSINSVNTAEFECTFPIMRIPFRYTSAGGGTFAFINPAGQPQIIDMRGVLLNSSATGSGGSSGATTIAQLTDVVITTPSDNEILKYNSTASQWENAEQNGWDDSVALNPTLSRRAYIGEGGHLTGIRTGALSRDAVNLHTVLQDGIFDRPVLSTLSTPPSSPNPGDRHIVGASATGLWANHDGDVAEAAPSVQDYTSWTSYSDNTTDSWATSIRDVAYAPEINTIVAVSGAGVTDSVMYSKDGGKTWQPASAYDNEWRGVCWSPILKMFIVVGRDGTGNRVMYSYDGINWTRLSGLSQDHDWRSVTWGTTGINSGRFVAVAADNYIMYSSDGLTWSTGTTITTCAWIKVTFGKGIFVAVGATGTNRAMYSDDGGETWSVGDLTEDNQWGAVAYGDGRFVAVAYSGANQVAVSTNGINWSLYSPAEVATWTGIAYSPSVKMFVAVSGSGTNRVMYSVDGTSWTGVSVAAESWQVICWCDECGNFVAVSYQGTGNRVLASDIDCYWMFGTPSEGDKVYDIATMSNCLYQGGAWQREFVWEFTTTTTNAAGSSSDSSTTLTPVLLSAGDGLDLTIEVGATLQSGAGTAFKQVRYDMVGYDGALNGTPENKIDGITGTNGITVLSVDVSAEYDVGSPTGEVNITVGHTVVSAAAETVLDWTVKVYGKWKDNLGDYC